MAVYQLTPSSPWTPETKKGTHDGKVEHFVETLDDEAEKAVSSASSRV